MIQRDSDRFGRNREQNMIFAQTIMQKQLNTTWSKTLHCCPENHAKPRHLKKDAFDLASFVPVSFEIYGHEKLSHRSKIISQIAIWNHSLRYIRKLSEFTKAIWDWFERNCIPPSLCRTSDHCSESNTEPNRSAI